ASGLPVGAQRKHVDFAVHPGVEILIGGVPGVVGHAVHVGCALAFTADKHAQALLGGRIAAVVQTVQLERLHDGADVLLGCNHARLIGAVHDVGHHQRGQHAHDDHDDHDFDEGKAALQRFPTGGGPV